MIHIDITDVIEMRDELNAFIASSNRVDANMKRNVATLRTKGIDEDVINLVIDTLFSG